MPAKTHIVKQGECISNIAFKYDGWPITKGFRQEILKWRANSFPTITGSAALCAADVLVCPVPGSKKN